MYGIICTEVNYLSHGTFWAGCEIYRQVAAGTIMSERNPALCHIALLDGTIRYGRYVVRKKLLMRFVSHIVPTLKKRCNSGHGEKLVTVEKVLRQWVAGYGWAAVESHIDASQ